MSDDVMVKVEGISKKFCRTLKRSLWYGVQDLAAELLRRDGYRDLRRDEFWAVRDVSFEVRRGEALGIIGPNGAGKTTMLRMLNGLIKPDRGKITMRGRVGALIALGAGFNPVLTGRENIYINAAVLGLSKRKVDKILGEIVDFAELHEFIDTPVQNYSSGMGVRLGFAVATQLDPDVLLIDEVLAVGDMAFQRKCIDRMKSLAKRGKTVVFVSHNIFAVQTLCDRAIWLEKGRIHEQGEAASVIAHYREEMYRRALHSTDPIQPRLGRWGSGEIRITGVEFFDGTGSQTNAFVPGDTMRIRLNYHASRPVKRPNFRFVIMTLDGVGVVSADAALANQVPEWVEGDGSVECVFDPMPFGTGREFSVYVKITSLDLLTDYDAWMDAARFSVRHVVHDALDGEKPIVRGTSLVSVPFKLVYLNGGNVGDTTLD